MTTDRRPGSRGSSLCECHGAHLISATAGSSPVRTPISASGLASREGAVRLDATPILHVALQARRIGPLSPGRYARKMYRAKARGSCLWREVRPTCSPVPAYARHAQRLRQEP